MDFARRLKALIKEGDKLQKEIAKDLNIPETTFSGYVRGKSRPDIETLVIIAEYFNVNTDYLLGLSESRKRIVLKREEFEHLIPLEYKEQTRDLKWVELEDFCKERDLTAENVRIIIETVLKQVK